jgi:hypothetical protein
LNIRVADVARVYREWRARGAEFLTEPKDHGTEIRCYITDPDDHLIEVRQVTGILNQRWLNGSGMAVLVGTWNRRSSDLGGRPL